MFFELFRETLINYLSLKTFHDDFMFHFFGLGELYKKIFFNFFKNYKKSDLKSLFKPNNTVEIVKTNLQSDLIIFKLTEPS